MRYPFPQMYYRYAETRFTLMRNYTGKSAILQSGHRLEVGENGLYLLNYVSIHQDFDYNIYISWQDFKDTNLKRLPCKVGASEMDAQSCSGKCLNDIMMADGYCTQYHPLGNTTVDDVRELCTMLKFFETPMTAHAMKYWDQPDMFNEKLKPCYIGDCLHPCDYQKYQISVSPSTRQSSAPVIVIRSDYTVIERTEVLACTPVTLVANIGGLLGLVLGSSVISLIHMMSMMCEGLGVILKNSVKETD